MKVTVLPVRDPQRQDRLPPARPAPPPLRPAPSSAFEGMASTSVELLRAQSRRPVPPPAASPEASASVTSAVSVSVPGAASGPRPAVAPPAVEIELRNGRIVRVPPGFASPDLERVLAIASADEPSSS